MNATLRIGRQSAGFITRGHPWVRPDRFTIGLERLRPGQPVTLVDEHGAPLAEALADPSSDICARVFARPGTLWDPAGALAQAWNRRRFADDTDCYRVVHGELDGLPGLRAERYGNVLVLVAFAQAIVPHLEALARTAADLLPGATVIVKEHRDDLRRSGVQVRGAVDPDLLVIGRELGVQVAVRPAQGLATGIYVDQRGTRRWLRQRCQGKRVLNLFAYTGLFSASLLQAGAIEAVDVDLSAPSLAIARENAERNGVTDRHRTVHGDCRGFLEREDRAYDLIICDPPTSAQGADGWVVRRDYPDLLRLAATRLAAGGLLVACCNSLHGKPFPLREAVAAALPGGRDVDAPGLTEDIPTRATFPEGKPFRISVRQPG